MFCGKAPTRQLHSIPIAVSGSGHTRKQINSLDPALHVPENPPHKRFLAGCSSPFMRLAEHLTAPRARGNNLYLVGENPMCSVPALLGCVVYGHTTTAMHDMSTTPFSPRSPGVYTAASIDQPDGKTTRHTSIINFARRSTVGTTFDSAPCSR